MDETWIDKPEEKKGLSPVKKNNKVKQVDSVTPLTKIIEKEFEIIKMRMSATLQYEHNISSWLKQIFMEKLRDIYEVLGQYYNNTCTVQKNSHKVVFEEHIYREYLKKVLVWEKSEIENTYKNMLFALYKEESINLLCKLFECILFYRKTQEKKDKWQYYEDWKNSYTQLINKYKVVLEPSPFTEKDLWFVSRQQKSPGEYGRVGSIYFTTGRIRLKHPDGPHVSLDDKFQEKYVRKMGDNKLTQIHTDEDFCKFEMNYRIKLENDIEETEKELKQVEEQINKVGKVTNNKKRDLRLQRRSLEIKKDMLLEKQKEYLTKGLLLKEYKIIDKEEMLDHTSRGVPRKIELSDKEITELYNLIKKQQGKNFSIKEKNKILKAYLERNEELARKLGY